MMLAHTPISKTISMSCRTAHLVQLRLPKQCYADLYDTVEK